MSQKTARIPKVGQWISADHMHVSPCNVRYKEPFGESEKDKALIENLKAGEIVGPFRARPEEDGFGVYVGRRRFLGKLAAGSKKFLVGTDVLISDVTEREARRASWTENLDILREEVDPIKRAEGLRDLMSETNGGLTRLAEEQGIPKSTLSEWLKVLQLRPSMQKAVSEGRMIVRDALEVARMELTSEKQDELAEVLETKGTHEFRKELQKSSGKLQRGIPAGKYFIIRTTFDKGFKEDAQDYEKLEKLADANHMEIDAYSKKVLKQHARTTKPS